MAACARILPAKSLVGSADQKTTPARTFSSGPSHPVPLPRSAAGAIPTLVRRGNRPTPRRLPDGIVQTRPPVSPFVDARHRPRVRLSPRRTPEGVSTTWTPHTKTPLPCSVVAGPKGPLLLGPHSHATALLPLERTGAKPVAQSSRISLTPPTMRGTGHHTGDCSTSRVSLVLRFQGRVASRCYPAGRTSYVRFSRSGIVSVVNGVTWNHFRRFQGAEHRWCRPGNCPRAPTPNRTCEFPSIRLSR